MWIEQWKWKDQLEDLWGQIIFENCFDQQEDHTFPFSEFFSWSGSNIDKFWLNKYPCYLIEMIERILMKGIFIIMLLILSLI